MTDSTTPSQTPEPTNTPVEAPAPVPAPTLPYEFKASLGEYRKRLGVARIVLAFALTLIFWFRFGPIVWIISVIGIAALIMVILYFLAARRLTMNADSLVFTGSFGKKRTVRYDELEGAKVFINYIEAGFGVTPRVAIAVKGGEPLVFSGLFWSVDELDKLLAVLRDKNVPTEYYADMATVQAVGKQFPAYATYAEKHTVLLATLITVGIIILLAVGIGLWVAFIE